MNLVRTFTFSGSLNTPTLNKNIPKMIMLLIAVITAYLSARTFFTNTGLTRHRTRTLNQPNNSRSAAQRLDPLPRHFKRRPEKYEHH